MGNQIGKNDKRCSKIIPFGEIVCQECSGKLVKEGCCALCTKCGVKWIIESHADGRFKSMRRVDFEKRIKKRDLLPNHKVVNLTKKGFSINFRDYLFLPKNSLAFTSLTTPQKQAIKNIEEYWINRIRNYQNWKFQKHWSYKKESISSRLDGHTFKSLKGNNNSKSIQNFVRKFLRDKEFRNKFEVILGEQYEKDPSDPRMELLKDLDITDYKQSLIEIFPHVVSGIVYVVEKELISFYFTFINEFSISYAIRTGLIHFRDLENQDPIEKEEVITILNEFINERVDQ